VDAECGKACWQYKRDTSTDETTGHLFALALMHDLLAVTPAEKAKPAYLICNMAKYIADNGFVYIDPATGNRTSWGYWYVLREHETHCKHVHGKHVFTAWRCAVVSV
jgi:hypothetical protein